MKLNLTSKDIAKIAQHYFETYELSYILSPEFVEEQEIKIVPKNETPDGGYTLIESSDGENMIVIDWKDSI